MIKHSKGWTVQRFGEVATITGGKRLPRGEKLTPYNTGHPYIRVSDMNESGIDQAGLQFVPMGIVPLISRYRVNAGDLYFSVAGTIGLVGEVPPSLDGANLTENADRISNIRMHKQFLLQILRSGIISLQTQSAITQNAQPKLALERLRKFEIPFPPLPEQRKIAQILGTWDEAIATTEKLIATLERRKRGLMQRLLTGQVRFPGFVDAWKVMQLGEFLRYTPRKVKKPTTAYNRMGIRSHGKGTFTGMVEDPNSNAMDYLYVVKADDLIVNITFAWEQAIAIVAPEDEDALVSHRFPTYTFRRNRVISEFFRYLMLTKRFLYQLDLITPGGAGRNRVMSKTDFLKLTVKVPSIAEQTLIGEALGSVDQNIKSRQLYLAALREQKKGLMQRLLTGQVRVAG